VAGQSAQSQSRLSFATAAMHQALLHGCAQGGSNIRLVEAVVERLLTSAVADMAIPVRRTVLESMKQMSDLDSYLAQADW